MEEVTSGMVQITGELELRIEHEDTTAMYHVKLKQMSNCFLWMSIKSDFLRWNLHPSLAILSKKKLKRVSWNKWNQKWKRSYIWHYRKQKQKQQQQIMRLTQTIVCQ